MRTEGFVFSDERTPQWLVARTERALGRLGIPIVRDLREARGPVWLVRAGAIPFHVAHAPRIAASATGRPLVGFGATMGHPSWRALLATSGGDLTGARLPRVDSVYLERPGILGRSTIEEIVADGAVRAVRIPSLDVVRDRKLRVTLAVTTLHRGGAEQVVLDLAREIRALGHDVTLAVVDRATRAVLDAPPGTIAIAEMARSRADRIAALAAIALAHGADVIHAHLLDGDELRLLARSGIPLVTTIHNSRPGWPARLEPLPDLALAIGCSRDVSGELAHASLAAPVRTIWNGIVPAPPRDRAASREALGLSADALVLLAIANHRPQKRLDRLPAIVAALRERGHDAILLLAGEPVRADPAAVAIGGLIAAEAKRLGVGDAVRVLGTRDDVATLHAAADVVVSTSAFEGLSLVHLEALAAGLPLVASRVSGTTELAAKHAAVTLLDLDAPAAEYADAVLAATKHIANHVWPAPPSPGGKHIANHVWPAPASRDAKHTAKHVCVDESAREATHVAKHVCGGETVRAGLAADFSARKMAERHLEVFRRVVARPRGSGSGVVLVTNNFSTGGAQSSARRLLVELARAGIPVRGCVIQEQREWPTPGRAVLEGAGIAVDVAPRAGDVDPIVTARAVVETIDRAAPAAVLFWNVIPEHKILIADMLLGVPVWDVSPGEMYFRSFDRYFTRPRAGLPYLDLRDYGRLLAGAIVKYDAESAHAADALGTSVHVVPNGVLVPARPIRRRAHDGVVIAGTLARIGPDKKLEQLVDAVAKMPRDARFELRIAGGDEDADYARDLRRRAEGLPIAFEGERDASTFLGEIDMFAMIAEPSGCPNASLEAMAAGLAVVATDGGGARDQITSDVGVLVPRGDSAALADVMHALCMEPARRERLGDAGHARARDRYDVARMAADYARICLGIETLARPSSMAAE